MKSNISKSIIILTGLFVIAGSAGTFATRTLVFADESPDSSQSDTTSTSDVPPVTQKHSGETIAAEREARLETQRDKLAAAKTKVCEVHQRVVKKIMSHVAARGERQIGVFDKIAQRVEAFADSHTKPSNYDALVADVNLKKTAAQDAVDAVKNADSFDCTNTDLKGVAGAFQTKAKAETQALKAYKTSIKNLIVVVKSAQPDSDGNGDTQQ